MGRNARVVTRSLDELRAAGSLAKGVKIKNDGMLSVICRGNHLDNADAQILELSQQLLKESAEKNIECIVVTKDINLRIQCDVMGVPAEDYETGKADTEEIYSGHRAIDIDDACITNFHSSKGIPVPTNENTLNPNEYLVMCGKSNQKLAVLGRVTPNGQMIKPLIQTPRWLGMISPRNKEQQFFMDALLDPDIALVTVAGRAGSGKTLIATAVGYYLTVVEKKFRKMLVARPTVTMGRDIGYLPGSANEKLVEWMRPVYDAFDLISDSSTKVQKNKSNKDTEKAFVDGRKMMEGCPKIEIEPLTYIRGRSIHNQFVLLDESQNTDPNEMKTILTRAGMKTKIVCTGDIEQIDLPYLDAESNGLSDVIEAFKGSGLAAHITLEKCIRSDLADAASRLL